MRIVSELILFGTALIWGMMIDAFYNVLRIFRQCVKHRQIWIGIEDVIFCFIAGVIMFMQILDSNDGIIRWYILFAAAFGIWLHYRTVGKLMVRISEKLANKTKPLVGKIVKIFINLFKGIASKILKKKLR